MIVGWMLIAASSEVYPADLLIAAFSADVTIPHGHRCMGILPTKSTTIDDPLEAHGFVLLGADKPIVLLALDWCEVRNGAYDEWREALANAAGTDRERILLSSLHQHDAPVTDSGAELYLDQAGLSGELYDREFQADCVRRVVAAMKESMTAAVPVTHLGHGQAKVQHVASSRRIVYPDGRVSFSRYSSSGGDTFLQETEEGDIDPLLRTISFWNGDVPILALHSYATHPMSHYGKGAVSADFPGRARRLREQDDPHVAQIYVSGCSGDVTAGKYNDGTPADAPAAGRSSAHGDENCVGSDGEDAADPVDDLLSQRPALAAIQRRSRIRTGGSADDTA